MKTKLEGVCALPAAGGHNQDRKHFKYLEKKKNKTLILRTFKMSKLCLNILEVVKVCLSFGCSVRREACIVTDHIYNFKSK